MSRAADTPPANASRANGRAVLRLLDAVDRARLTPMDVLLLLDIAEAEATVVELAARLDRRPADVRRATARLVARGLLRRRSDRTVRWGLTFTATAAGEDLLRRVGLDSALAGATAVGRRPARREPGHRRLSTPARARTPTPAQASSAPSGA